MKPLPLIFCFVIGLVAPSFAREFALPEAKPVAKIDVPDAWKPEFIARGIQIKSPDGSVFLSVESTTNPQEMTTIVDETDALLKAHKVSLDKSSRKDRKFLLNSLPAEELLFTGRDEDGPTTVSITFVTVKDRAFVLTSWATVDGYTKHRPELDKIMQSTRAVGN